MRSFALTSLLVVWLGAVSGANATEVHLIGRSPQTSPGGSGCGPAAVVTLQLPQGARSLNPTILGVGSFLDGPDGFGGESGASDGHYAQIQRFAATPTAAGPVAQYSVQASARWCAGWTGDPARGPAVPASEQVNPQDDPTYHSGWRTTPWVFAVRYVLDRSAVYTVDAGGHVRARPPRNVGISRRHHLVARQIRWRGWGQQETHGHGVVRFRERTYRVDVSFSNPELGGDPEGGVPRCRVGRAYYQDLFVRVPAWHRAAGYTLTSRCQDSAVNNIQGDLRPPGG